MAKKKANRTTRKRRQTRRQQKAMFANIAKKGSKHKGKAVVEIDSFGDKIKVNIRNRQIGKTTPRVDKRIRALHPGRRLSTSGNVYYEYRKNRSDKNRKTNI